MRRFRTLRPLALCRPFTCFLEIAFQAPISYLHRAGVGSARIDCGALFAGFVGGGGGRSGAWQLVQGFLGVREHARASRFWRQPPGVGQRLKGFDALGEPSCGGGRVVFLPCDLAEHEIKECCGNTKVEIIRILGQQRSNDFRLFLEKSPCLRQILVSPVDCAEPRIRICQGALGLGIFGVGLGQVAANL